ncbi:MAG: hypothetical protein ACI4T3_05400 [Lactobacillus sp.]
MLNWGYLPLLIILIDIGLDIYYSLKKHKVMVLNQTAIVLMFCLIAIYGLNINNVIGLSRNWAIITSIVALAWGSSIHDSYQKNEK